ncbi:DUF397 domain-containing protein [Actinomadura sp. HBU206391]|uniref:DUF397 domain-containing protein n=1 Tax=Actinomadura sp. HBU206391 TaxID=2731692 RepID=UPI001650B6CD|nr:DUF397 domain-containing protein [Actinomadura sp. HBU206391]MBC6461184.1 DUF397 domain-containing protein [Actinomadura sp. HBU206391]
MDLSRATWRKATRSTDNGGDCVEIAGLPGVIAVRDSKNPGGPALVFGRAAFRAFAAQLKQQR